MVQNQTVYVNKGKEPTLFIYIFYIWTFILIARPQDFIDALIPLRPALSVGIVVVVFYLFYQSRYKNRLLVNEQCKLYIYLLAAMIMSIPFAFYRRGAFDFFFTKYMILVLFFLLFFKLIDSDKKIKGILWTACIANSLYLISAVRHGDMASGRLRFGQMLDPNDLAYFAVSFLPFNLIFMTIKDSSWKRLVSLFNVSICILIIFMTGSRGGFLALAMVVVMMLFARGQIIKKSYKVLIVVLTVTVLVYGSTTIDYSRIGTMTQIGDDYNIYDETGRIAIWKTGIYFMLMNPLTGVGISCFGEAIGQDRIERGLQDIWQAPHNSLVQIGTETGLPGLILFVLISYKAFRVFGNTKSAAGAEQMAIIGAMAQIGFVGHFVASMFLSQAYSGIWILFIALSATLSEYAKNNRIPDEQ
jgi:O-antigen ligase